MRCPACHVPGAPHAASAAVDVVMGGCGYYVAPTFHALLALLRRGACIRSMHCVSGSSFSALTLTLAVARLGPGFGDAELCHAADATVGALWPTSPLDTIGSPRNLPEPPVVRAFAARVASTEGALDALRGRVFLYRRTLPWMALSAASEFRSAAELEDALAAAIRIPLLTGRPARLVDAGLLTDRFVRREIAAADAATVVVPPVPFPRIPRAVHASLVPLPTSQTLRDEGPMLRCGILYDTSWADLEAGLFLPDPRPRIESTAGDVPA